jgi:hypothetical protein
MDIVVLSNNIMIEVSTISFTTDIVVLFFDITVFTISKITDIVVLTYDIVVSTISNTPDIGVFDLQYHSFCNIGYYDFEGQDYDIDGQYRDTIL